MSAKFMKVKVKRLIAREGLIIISLLLLAGISFALDLWLQDQRSFYYANVQEIEPIVPGQIAANKPPDSWIPEGIVLQFPKNTSHDVITQTIKRDFPNIKGEEWEIFDSPQGKNVDASYDEKGKRVFENIIYKINFSGIYIFFLLFAYPLYLLVRFVVWAIGTLKEKGNMDA